MRVVLLASFLVICGCVSYPVELDQKSLAERLAGKEQLRLPRDSYVLRHELVVPAGKRLDIQAGTQLRFEKGGRIVVKGKAHFLGTSEEPVRVVLEQPLDSPVQLKKTAPPDPRPGSVALCDAITYLKNMETLPRDAADLFLSHVEIREEGASGGTKSFHFAEVDGGRLQARHVNSVLRSMGFLRAKQAEVTIGSSRIFGQNAHAQLELETSFLAFFSNALEYGPSDLDLQEDPEGLFIQNSSDVLLVGNDFAGFPDDSVEIWNSRGIVRGNRFQHCGDSCLDLKPGTKFRIDTNRFLDSKIAISAKSGAAAFLAGNTFERVGEEVQLVNGNATIATEDRIAHPGFAVSLRNYYREMPESVLRKGAQRLFPGFSPEAAANRLQEYVRTGKGDLESDPEVNRKALKLLLHEAARGSTEDSICTVGPRTPPGKTCRAAEALAKDFRACEEAPFAARHFPAKAAK